MPESLVLEDPTTFFKKFQSVSTGAMEYEGAPRGIELVTRHDPLFPFYRAVISQERANRQKPAQPPEPVRGDKKASCFFEADNIHKTPEPRIYYPEHTVDGFVPVSVPNLFGFALEGRVNCFTAHDRCDPTKFNSQDMHAYLAMSRKNALLVKARGHDRMFNFINFGVKAAGTQEHPHSQDGVINTNMFESAGPIGANAAELRYYAQRWSVDGDVFDRYNMIASKSAFWGFETSSAVVMAPYAPRYPDQLDILVKSPIGNFTDLSPLDLPGIASALASAINYLTTKRGVTDFNLITHQTPFSENARSVYQNYRLHWHLCPRNKNLAGGIEVDGAFNVIDVFPEHTASGLRDYIAAKSLNTIPELVNLGK